MPSRGAVATEAQPLLMGILDMVDRPHRACQRQLEAFVRGSIRLLRNSDTACICGAGGTVLPRRRPRGSLDVACFTRDASSLTARFCNATPFSEVALSDGRTSSRSFPCWSFCEIRSSFRARRNAPTPLGHVLDLRWPCPKSSGKPFFNGRRDDDGRTSNRGVIGIRDIKATEEIQTTMVRLQAEPVERK